MSEGSTCFSVHLSTATSWRGGENQILLLCRGLAARGQQVRIVAPPDAPLLERAREAGLDTHALKLREVDPAGTLRLARLLRKWKPDILHLHDGHAVLPGQLAARALPRARLKVFAHRRTVFKLRSKWKYGSRVDRVIAISAAVKEQVLAAGIPEASVAVVFSGLEFPEVLDRESPEALALRKELGLPPGALVAAHAAALTAEKRQADITAAVALLAHKVKGAQAPDVHLVLAGTGELAEQLKQHVVSQGVAGRIHWLGFRKDLRALWAVADWAVFASEAEGLCTALVEAQGAGLPAVVTRAGGMPEVVAEGETGLIVPIGDVQALAQAMGRLATDVELRKSWGQAARARARKNFSAEAMTARMLALYRQALASR